MVPSFLFHCFCLCVPIYVWLSFCPSLGFLSVCLLICLSVFRLSLAVPIVTVCLSLSLSVSVSFCLSVSLPVRLSLSLSLSVFCVCLLVCKALSVSVSLCLPPPPPPPPPPPAIGVCFSVLPFPSLSDFYCSLCFCQSVSVCLSLSLCLSISLCPCLCLSVCLSSLIVLFKIRSPRPKATWVANTIPIHSPTATKTLLAILTLLEKTRLEANPEKLGDLLALLSTTSDVVVCGDKYDFTPSDEAGCSCDITPESGDVVTVPGCNGTFDVAADMVGSAPVRDVGDEYVDRSDSVTTCDVTITLGGWNTDVPVLTSPHGFPPSCFSS